MKLLIIEQLRELAKIEDEFSFGELLYTILRPKYLGHSKVSEIKWLLEVTDNDFFTASERAVKEANKV